LQAMPDTIQQSLSPAYSSRLDSNTITNILVVTDTSYV
jgi:hypothetical protein